MIQPSVTNQIIQSIKYLVPLNAQEEDAFLKILQITHFKKKEFLLQEGKVCNKITFINNGCMRLFYNVDGIENTIQFFFGDTWYTDYASFLTNQPSVENLQALENTEVIQFGKEDLNKLCNEYPIFDRVARVMAENAYLSLSQLNKMLTNEEPTERYLNLLKLRPDVVEKIPQHYIASYLGIKPESLSRIRKRILIK
jgi:CRP/FNR family transcriptional regulator, anaerobic regulatory protein